MYNLFEDVNVAISSESIESCKESVAAMAEQVDAQFNMIAFGDMV